MKSTLVLLEELFAAEQASQRLHTQLSEASKQRRSEIFAKTRQLLVVSLSESSDSAKEDSDPLRDIPLICLARLLGEYDGAEPTDLLIELLNDRNTEVRAEAGEQLEQRAFERFKELALGVERALKRYPDASLALVELPFVMHEVPEPGVVSLLLKFLHHKSADVVAAAIESLAEIGDPRALTALSALSDDTRMSSLGEDELEDAPIGALAQDAMDVLSQFLDQDGEIEA